MSVFKDVGAKGTLTQRLTQRLTQLLTRAFTNIFTYERKTLTLSKTRQRQHFAAIPRKTISLGREKYFPSEGAKTEKVSNEKHER